MRTTKKGSVLDTLASQIDEREYKRIKSRMGLAAKISDLLKEKGLSQKEFAQIMGKKPSEISKWLTGNHNFTHDTLVDIQDILDTSLINSEITTSKVQSLNKIECTIKVKASNVSTIISTKSSFTQSFCSIGQTGKQTKGSILH